jgi:hypothetical protein
MEEHQESNDKEEPAAKSFDPENATVKIVVSKAPGAGEA